MSRRSFRVGRSKTGLGLFATREIPKGEVIVRYRGQKIRNDEADRRADRGNKYLYEVNNRWTIDGSSRKNVARYANHSCRPNAESDVLRGHKVIIRAIKKILPGQEILYDYGKDYFDLILKPIGCKCDKCEEKRKAERAEKRRLATRKRAREAKKAAAQKETKRKVSARKEAARSKPSRKSAGKASSRKAAPAKSSRKAKPARDAATFEQPLRNAA